MRFILSVSLLILLTTFNTFALELKPIPAGKDPLLGSPSNSIACDQIVNAMADLQTKISRHETSLTAFLMQVTQGLRDWNSLVVPFEGQQTKPIPVGSFSVLLDAAEKTEAITKDAYDNTDYVTEQMANIVAAARACSITTPTPPLK